MTKKRCIVHIDMDAFFASIEERDRPALRGLPIVVGADPLGGKGRGVVSTCSYAARKYGIHSAMPISTAFRKCPDAVFLPVDIDKYSKVSGEIYEILYSFSPDIEPVSIDEAFLDITGSYHLFGALPIDTCMLIKSRIKELTALTASVGLAPTKMAAKIASDIDKPDGLVAVTKEGLDGFLRSLEVRRIWGLGRKGEEALSRLGIRTIGELADSDPKRLTSLFGRNGAGFWRLAHGIDESKVEPAREAKSVSNETTFDVDTLEPQKIEGALLGLSERVSLRLRKAGLKARTITLKIRLEDFSTFTRAATIDNASNFIDILYRTVKTLHRNFDTKGKRIRLLGVRASNFCRAGFPDSLFSGPADNKCEATHRALDRIREKYGDSSIFMAGSKT